MAVMIESIGMEMSDEQVLPVVHPLGSPALVIAGAGSGKTRVMTARVMWLIAEGMNPRRIAGITFTNKAADELRHRVGYGNDPNVGPRISTIHSLALSAIRKNPEGFGLAKTVSPLDTSDGMDLMKRLIDRHKKDPLFDAVEPWPLMEKIEYHRARGVGFAVDYTEEVHAAAQRAHKGYHVLTTADHALWAEFEQAKTAASLVDFSDMLHLVVRRGRTDDAWRAGVQRQFLTVLVDESQDCNTCHPPGTMVLKVDGFVSQRKKGKTANTFEVPIETLKDGDRVVPWKRRHGRLMRTGMPIKVGVREFRGELIEVTCGDKKVQMTPDHRVYATINDYPEGYALYLMWKRGFGFRVGQCSLKYRRRSGGKSTNGAYGGFIARVMEEKADKAWILKVFDNNLDSRAWEQVISCRHGIPTAQFISSNGDRQQEFIRIVFGETEGRGEECLEAFGLRVAFPLYNRGDGGVEKVSAHKRWFETRALNLIPGLMSLPAPENGKRLNIDSVKKVAYNGPVYSMDVEEHHTYVANGIVVKNCQWEFIELLLAPENYNLFAVGDISQSIYGFSGASPDTLGEMVESWRGVVPSLYKLEDNYRSLEKLVKFSNGIQQTMTDTVPLTMKHKRDSVEFPGLVRLVQNQTSRDIAQQVAETIAKDNVLKRSSFKFKDNAILVRSKGQIRDVEEALVCRRIPYIIRGGQSLLQTEEARDLFSYLRLIVNPADVTAFGRAVSVPPRKVGIVTVEKLRKVAEAKYGGDLAVAAAKGEGVALPAFGDFLLKLRKVESLSEALLKIINFTDYHELIKDRYRAKRDLIDLKRDNVGKIQEMIAGMVAENPTMTPSDLIFRLTLNGKEEAKTEEGAVVISTIHSAKGLEWPRVYVTNCVEGSLPHQWSSTAKEVEEERRLFYVACTRAKDALYLCVPHLVIRGPNTARVEPSRFLLDLGINV